MYFYTPAHLSCWGYIDFTPSARLSVRRAFRVHSITPTVWDGKIHIMHKWSLAREGVSRIMTFDLELYLQGYFAVTLPILWIIFIRGTNATHEATMCHAPPFPDQRSGLHRWFALVVGGGGGGVILVGHWSTMSSLYLSMLIINTSSYSGK